MGRGTSRAIDRQRLRSVLLHTPTVATTRTMARTQGIMFVVAGLIGVIPTTELSRTATIFVNVASVFALGVGVALLLRGHRFPRPFFHLFILFAVGLLTLSVVVTQEVEEATTYGFLYLFAITAASFFSSWLGFIAHMAVVLAACGWSLSWVGVDAERITVYSVAMAGLGLLTASLVRLAEQAEEDALTGLSNRRALGRRLDDEVEVASRARRALSVVALDLDGFKAYNDTRGHLAGDELLVAVADHWRTIVPDDELLTRVGGDEFILLLPGYSPAAAADLADRMRGGLPASITASAGVAGWEPGESASIVTNRADAALYEAKSTGRDRTVVFGDSDRSLSELEGAIAAGQLVMHYQPIVRLPDHEVVSYEALVRWNHPAAGMIGPGAFVGEAERTGAIHALGAWTLDQACRAARAQPGGVTVSVNVSVVELRSPAYAGRVRDAVETHRVPPGKLVIEVTEAVYDNEDQQVTTNLHALRSLGVRVAIDDFGSGYSSLRWLSKYPLDILKIDGAFVRQLADDVSALPILETIVELGRKLGVVVVAEQVETEDQARVLCDLGCDRAQGYYFGRPGPLLALPAEEGTR